MVSLDCVGIWLALMCTCGFLRTLSGDQFRVSAHRLNLPTPCGGNTTPGLLLTSQTQIPVAQSVALVTPPIYIHAHDKLHHAS